MKKLPILIVDDNQDACAMMAKLLSAFGYQTDVAYEGAAAMKLVEETEYGIAIIDYLMPGMNGVDLFREMRKVRPDLAGVFLTGHTTIDVVYPAIQAGILRILPKPADFEELIPIIEEHLGSVA
jgi:DNA-binding NtrC family response regulator